ncbi:MAG TPA: hypothetical protein VMZ52_05820 [Bryobacteraceae bacterium]|nr:hypothetical protein [Bryobacteraceae bacterium]
MKILYLAVLVSCGTGLARAGDFRAGLFPHSLLRLAMATMATVSATPGNISFQATNPDMGTVSASSPGSLTWTAQSGSHLQNWTVTVQASSSSLAGCPAIPVSAIRVSCGSATVSGGGGTGACSSGSFPLSTSPQQIAGGAQGDGANSYSVSMNFTLADSWRYLANSACTLTLTYSVNAP